MSPTLDAHGVTVSPPAGFEGRIFRRPAHGELAVSAADGPSAPPGEVPNTVVHVATIALPADVGDFASGAVEDLGRDDVLIVLFEYGGDAARQPLFARAGMPRTLDADEFSPKTLQRTIPGQAGCQVFFNERDRAFCLYVVLGSFARRRALVDRVNEVLATVRIAPLSGATAPSPPTTQSPTTTQPAPTTQPPSTTQPASSTTRPRPSTTTTPPPPPSTATP